MFNFSSFKGSILDLQLWNVENSLYFRQQVARRSNDERNVHILNNTVDFFNNSLDFELVENNFSFNVSSLCIVYHNNTIMELVDYIFSGIVVPIKTAFTSDQPLLPSYSSLSLEELQICVQNAFNLKVNAINLLAVIPSNPFLNEKEYIIADISQVNYILFADIVNENLVTRSKLDFKFLNLFSRFYDSNLNNSYDILITKAENGLELGFIHPTNFNDGRRMECYLDLRDFVGIITAELFDVYHLKFIFFNSRLFYLHC